jgi:SAM-dependent methyltransferase
MTASDQADLPESVRRNRSAWDKWAVEFVEGGERSWAQAEMTWGVWAVPESQLKVLPDVSGMDVIELGCGTAYISAWLARRGARPIGLDNSEQQLITARRLQDEHGLHFPLIHGYAEAVPLPDASFDLVISEYGASLWADPYRWIPEAARLLRPGGWLVFLGNSSIFLLCVPDDDGTATTRLQRPYFGMHRLEWPGYESVEFHLGYGDCIRLLRANDFEIEDLIETRPAEGSTREFPWATVDWARRWPKDQIWKARKRGRGT